MRLEDHPFQNGYGCIYNNDVRETPKAQPLQPWRKNDGRWLSRTRLDCIDVILKLLVQNLVLPTWCVYTYGRGSRWCVAAFRFHPDTLHLQQGAVPVRVIGHGWPSSVHSTVTMQWQTRQPRLHLSWKCRSRSACPVVYVVVYLEYLRKNSLNILLILNKSECARLWCL